MALVVRQPLTMFNDGLQLRDMSLDHSGRIQSARVTSFSGVCRSTPKRHFVI